MVLIGKDLPRPTPYAAADKNKARKADSHTVTRLAKQSVTPKASRIGHAVLAGISMGSLGLCSSFRIFITIHRPMRYTTVNTTIHTPSTKCQ